MLHHGHLKRLEEAKKLGDFIYVGLWDDEMVKYYRGGMYPIVSLQERVLMALACKHVDDLVIGAPYEITEDLIKSLNIQKVVHVLDTGEDGVLEQHADVDQFAIPRKMGILHEITIDDSFYQLTVEKLAQRVMCNKTAVELKLKKKTSSNDQYYRE